MSRLHTFLGVVVGALALVGATPASSLEVHVAPVTRLPFPERGYVVRVPEAMNLDAASIEVRENGLPVDDVRVDLLASSGLRFGVVLAIDASESMTGAPAAAALQAARAFVSHRTDAEQVGIVTFNGDIAVLQKLTAKDDALARTLGEPPALAYGTRIHDAVTRSVGLLRRAKLSSSSIVLLSDGADIGSSRSLDEAVAAAKKQGVRIFTVGLRSGAFEAGSLKRLARETGGSHVEARSAGQLAGIYAQLGEQLAGEYLVRYRSAARPMSQVEVEFAITGVGDAATSYVAPTPSLLPPYHRSPLSTFLLSGSSHLLLSVVFALLVGVLLLLIVRRPGTTVVDRVAQFSGGARNTGAKRDAEVSRPVPRKHYAGGWWAALESDLELARMTVTPRQVVGLALGASFVTALLAFLLSVPLLAVFGLATPFVARGIVRRKVKAIRSEFAEQFPASLQVLASALRAGHSFNGALDVVVDNAAEPARSELARVVQDDRLGVLPEDAIRRLARRMDNRDIEQVALLAELQRTTGGNSAEILDTVVATIRERAEIRRLVRTLTAQGRMARWILTALPIVLAAFLFVVHPDVMARFVSSGAGQMALVAAALMVAAGSVVIQRIVDIDA